MKPHASSPESGGGTGSPDPRGQGGFVLEVAADRSLRSIVQHMREKRPQWIVAVRAVKGSLECYYYAFQPDEIERLAVRFAADLDISLEGAADLHEWKSSGTSRNGRLLGTSGRGLGPTAERVVNFDLAHRVIGVDELGAGAAGADGSMVRTPDGAAPAGTLPNLGPLRGVSGLGPPRAPPPAASPVASAAAPLKLEVILSAEAQSAVAIGAIARVPFQIDLSSEALPLSTAVAATMDPGSPVRVVLSAQDTAVHIEGASEREILPPSQGQPSGGVFMVKGVTTGIARLAVGFWQGGSQLGVIGLSIEVVSGTATSHWNRTQAVAVPRDLTDDEMVEILIDRCEDGGRLYYEYTLHAEGLNVPWVKLRSKPLLDRGGGPAQGVLQFVERIYECVTQQLKSFSDLQQLQREARALGASLSQELLDPEVTKVLWPLRDRIKLVRIVSWEPYIPWELVRLHDPVSGDIDERFLCEYGLVRSFTDEILPRTLSLQRWAYLGAQVSSLPSVGAELAYFTATTPESLRGHGITPLEIPATRDGFYDALEGGDFDVLHISCHAESQHGSIERSRLIIGEETAGGTASAQLVEVDTVTVEAEAKLRNRRPLVFLNGCETGRVGALLTGWGGWPNVFVRKGAGAFIGSSWSVRDEPAAAFATAFYNSLLAGNTLTEAATAARVAAKALGDASWLAFKVYGHPRARYSPSSRS
ncbi:MAG TPA: CHAT domain-containing protein [Steroidobacteraceae bacterium]